MRDDEVNAILNASLDMESVTSPTAVVCAAFNPAHHLISLITAKVTTTPPPFVFDHEKGFK